MKNFIEELKQYFEKTPREKVLEDWEKTKELNDVGIKVEDFLQTTKKNLKFYKNK